MRLFEIDTAYPKKSFVSPFLAVNFAMAVEKDDDNVLLLGYDSIKCD
jgi:hypothetical protein